MPGRQKAARYVAPRVRAIDDVQMRRLGERHVQMRRLGEWRAEVVDPPVVV